MLKVVAGEKEDHFTAHLPDAVAVRGAMTSTEPARPPRVTM